MTQGRCFVGLARGAHTRAVNVLADKFGIKAPHPGFTDAAARKVNQDRFIENFEVMKMAWTQDTVTFKGEYWQIPPDDVVFGHEGTAKYGRGQDAEGRITEIGIVPRPYTKPYPQVYVPFTASPATVEWCAREQIRLVAFTSIHEQIDAILTRYQAAANEAGHAIGYGDGVAHFKTIIVADTEEEARFHAEKVQWAWAEWLGGYGFNEAFRLPGETTPIPNDFDVTQRGHGFIVYGTPDQVLRRLEPFVEQYNVGELFNWVFNGVMSHDAILKSIELYAEKVVPQLG
jgi:alkanesulfonate monooxygenase SsuD/methylene tetrahydromethanopterin reductase-like flavin-dependent oxidoreductase (luciferase family)